MLTIALLFGVPLGFVLGIVALGAVKKITREVGFWAAGICFGAWGFALSFLGVTMEVTMREQLGLILVVLGGSFMACSGLFASVGIKFQGERKALEMEQRLTRLPQATSERKN